MAFWRAFLTVVGTVVGAIFGMPGLGYAIGATLGGLVDPMKPGAPLIRVNISQSSYGAMIPIIYGKRVRIPGNMHWYTKPVSTGVHQSDNYREHFLQDMAFGLCEGPCLRLVRVWADNQLIYDARTPDEILYDSKGNRRENVEELGIKIMSDGTIIRAKYPEIEFVFYPGNEDQLPDPLIVADKEARGKKASAYRGECYVRLGGVPINKFDYRIPNFEWEVEKTNLAESPLEWQPLELTGTDGSAPLGVHPQFDQDRIFILAKTASGLANVLAKYDGDGVFISSSLLSTVNAVSSNDFSNDIASTIGTDEFLYAATEEAAGANRRLSKINLDTMTEVAAVAFAFPAATWGLAAFQLGGTNYIMAVGDGGSAPDVQLFNADTMTSLGTLDILNNTYFSIFMCTGDQPDVNTQNVYILTRHGGTNPTAGPELFKVTYNLTTGLSSSSVKAWAPGDVVLGWDFTYDVYGIGYVPSDQSLIVLIEGESDFPFSLGWYDLYEYDHIRMLKVNKDTGETIWSRGFRGPINTYEYHGVTLGRSDLSADTYVVVDGYYFQLVEIDLKTGQDTGNNWWSEFAYEGTAHWDSVRRKLITTQFGDWEIPNTFGAVATLPPVAAEPKWKTFEGGWCTFGGWHDPQTGLYYILRETHDYEGYELCKVDTASGEIIQRRFWSYTETDDDTPGDPNNVQHPIYQASNVFGSMYGDKLYMWTAETIGFSNSNEGVIEFDKGTLEITDTFLMHTGGPKRHGDNGGGMVFADGPGKTICRLGGTSLGGGFPNPQPATEHFAEFVFPQQPGPNNHIYQDFFNQILNADQHYMERGGWFDRTGHFHIVFRKFTPANSHVRSTDFSQVFVGPIGLVGGAFLIPSLLVSPEVDLFGGFPDGSKDYVFHGVTYDPETHKAYFFTAYDVYPDNVQPVFEWDMRAPPLGLGWRTVIGDFPQDSVEIWEREGWNIHGHYLGLYDRTIPSVVFAWNILNAKPIPAILTQLDIEALWDVPDGHSGSTDNFHSFDPFTLTIANWTGWGFDDSSGGYISTIWYNPNTEDQFTLTLGDLCRDLSERVGYTHNDHFNYDRLTQIQPSTVVASRMSPAAIMESLKPGYFFDIVEYDWILQGIRRDNTIIAGTILEEDLLLTEQNKLPSYQFSIKDNRETTSIIDVSYFDIDLDHQVGVQRAKKTQASEGAISTNPTSVNIPISTDSDFAATAGTRLLWSYTIEYLNAKFQLPISYLKYAPGDVVLLQKGIELLEHRIVQQGIGTNNALAFDSVNQDRGSYSVVAIGTNYSQTPSGGGGGGIISTPANPVMFVLDTSLISTTFNTIGNMLGAGPDDGDRDWIAGALEKSLNNINWTELGGSPAAPTYGDVSFALTAYTSGGIDTTTTFRIGLRNGTFTSCTVQELLDDPTKNLVLFSNGELVQFADADIYSDGIYDCTNLIRGCFGTEWAIGTHGTDERVTLIELTKFFNHEYPVTQIGATTYYRATSPGVSPPESPVITHVQETNRLKPWAPYNIKVTRAGDVINGTFNRRSRFPAAVFNTDPPWGEDIQAFEIDVYNGVNVVRTITGTASANGSVINPTASTFVYDDADQVIDFGSVQGAVTIRMYQLSATVGRGYTRQVVV